MQLGRQTLSQAVSAAVLDRIRSGEFGPGDRLPTEKTLMQEYGVGRNSVREAVQALVTLGLVDVRPGRGATVIGIESERRVDAETLSVLLKEEAVDDLCVFRRLLEIEIACGPPLRRLLAISPTSRHAMRAFAYAHAQGSPGEQLDDAFHAAVARASHNSGLRDGARRGERLIANARRLTTTVAWASERARVEHRRLYEAICAHDPEAAAAVMGTHLNSAIQAIAEGRANAAAELTEGAR